MGVEAGHGANLMNWLDNIHLQGHASRFDLRFMLIWSLWKNRNNVLWNGKPLNPLEIVL